MNNLEKYFDKKLWDFLKSNIANITEIRLRVNQPLIIYMVTGELVCDKFIPAEKDLELIFNRLTNFSAYAYEDEIKEGYLTIPGGHRVGLAGEMIVKDGQYIGMKNICYLNFRICHRIKNFGIDIFQKIINGQTIRNTLIISKPGMGKTTLLRNIVKYISDNQSGTSITVIDERSEISGAYMGVPQTDLGIRTDVFCGINKERGILMAVRSMAPKIIAVDEIGATEDFFAIHNAMNCGTKIIATIHGSNLEDTGKRIGEELIRRFELILYIEKKGVIRVI